MNYFTPAAIPGDARDPVSTQRVMRQFPFNFAFFAQGWAKIRRPTIHFTLTGLASGWGFGGDRARGHNTSENTRLPSRIGPRVTLLYPCARSSGARAGAWVSARSGTAAAARGQADRGCPTHPLTAAQATLACLNMQALTGD